MYILSQDRRAIIKSEDIGTEFIGNKLRITKLVTDNKSIVLGNYSSEDRTQEVINLIWGHMTCADCYYEMPKE